MYFHCQTLLGCLEQLSRLIENYGLSVCQPSPTAALKEIAKQISDRDNSVRNAALNCVIVAYFIAGDKIRQMIGQVTIVQSRVPLIIFL